MDIPMMESHADPVDLGYGNIGAKARHRFAGNQSGSRSTYRAGTSRPRSLPAGQGFEPIERFAALNRNTPLTARLRWVFIAVLFLGIVAVAIVFGFLMTRDIRRQNRLEAELEDTLVVFNVLESLVANLTEPPNCTLVTNFTATSSFSSDLFAIFDNNDPTAEFQFNLTNIDPSSTVLWTWQDKDGVIAYLSDIPPINSSFPDNLFLLQNAADNTKQLMFNVAGAPSATVITLTVQDASGTIALLSDIPTQPTVFLDDVFAVQNAVDNTKEVMLDVSGVSTSTTRIMTIQNATGVIAYLENITASGPPFSDVEFILFEDGDPTAQVRFDLSLITSGTNVTLTVQDLDGTIAYLSDIPQIVEVLVNTTRSFPDIANEGVSNVTQLGDVAWIEVSVCGGGGGGGAGAGGGGGGSGSGHENFRIYEPVGKFYRFTCTVGIGGAAGTGGMSGGDGNATTLRGVSDTLYYLNLMGHGGGGGEPTTAGGAAGGGGGGGDSSASGTTPGDMGVEGGLAGGAGGLVTGSETFTDGVRGGINLSWRAGGGGSAATAGTPATVSRAAAWNGAYATNASACDGSTGCGAASMFGPGGIGSGNPDGALCAGGGSAGDGGGGACFFRYYLLP